MKPAERIIPGHSNSVRLYAESELHINLYNKICLQELEKKLALFPINDEEAQTFLTYIRQRIKTLDAAIDETMRNIANIALLESRNGYQN